ncbi:hypothetical protein TNCV_4157071 [Trichonephila clavipes]|nr:hypothetical protein TNCV_4157071 [Trichonephila clavipes]
MLDDRLHGTRKMLRWCLNVFENIVVKHLYKSLKIHTSRIRRLRESIRRKRPQFWHGDDWYLLHDNAPAHESHLSWARVPEPLRTIHIEGLMPIKPVETQNPYEFMLWKFCRVGWQFRCRADHLTEVQDPVKNEVLSFVGIGKITSNLHDLLWKAQNPL